MGTLMRRCRSVDTWSAGSLKPEQFRQVLANFNIYLSDDDWKEFLALHPLCSAAHNGMIPLGNPNHFKLAFKRGSPSIRQPRPATSMGVVGTGTGVRGRASEQRRTVRRSPQNNGGQRTKRTTREAARKSARRQRNEPTARNQRSEYQEVSKALKERLQLPTIGGMQNTARKKRGKHKTLTRSMSLPEQPTRRMPSWKYDTDTGVLDKDKLRTVRLKASKANLGYLSGRATERAQTARAKTPRGQRNYALEVLTDRYREKVYWQWKELKQSCVKAARQGKCKTGVSAKARGGQGGRGRGTGRARDGSGETEEWRDESGQALWPGALQWD